MLINSVRESAFPDFITAIFAKKDWCEELCTCCFQSGDPPSYWFETFEGDTVLISYEDVAEYVKLAVIRYLQGCSVKEKRERIERIIQNTIFASAMDLIAQTPPSGIPLVYG